MPLLRECRLIMLDLRGFGWSSVPPDGDDKETIAGDVLALMDAMRIDRAGLVGHDWGGWTGFLVSLSAPERISWFTPVATAHPFPSVTLPSIVQSWRFRYQAVIGAPLLGRTPVGRVIGTDEVGARPVEAPNSA